MLHTKDGYLAEVREAEKRAREAKEPTDKAAWLEVAEEYRKLLFKTEKNLDGV